MLACTVCIIFNTGKRCIADISDQGAIFTEEQSAEVNMPPRSDIEAMDRPTVLYVIYHMVSVQQMNRDTAEYFRNNAFFHLEVYSTYIRLRRNTQFSMVAQSPYMCI